MSEVSIGLIGLGVLLALFVTGLELAFAMIVVGFAGFAYIISPDAALNLLAKDVFECFQSYGLMVVPLFLFMGQIAFRAGIASRLYDTANKFVGHISGGLGIATVAGCAIFGAICGSAAATSATFAAISVPEMDKVNYSRKFSTGLVSIAGTLGILVPPSVPLIIYGILTQQSIGKLFVAGIVPAIIGALLFILIIVGRCKINPSIAPRWEERFGWRTRFKSLSGVAWPLAIFVVVMGGLLLGFFTPTEAGSVGAFAVLLVSLANRNLNTKAFITSVTDSLLTATMMFFLLSGSVILGHFLAVTKIPIIASEWLIGLPLPPPMIIGLICLIYLLGGSFIDDLAFMILATPIFYPAVVKLGYDPIWFGIMIVLTIMIGVVLPPVALCVFVVKNVTNTPYSEIYAGVYPFLIGFVICAILLFIFPELALYLPNLLYN
jgi:C4-dicarboxylate transporter DctM subunit